jgi:hypothetical protein
MKIEIFSIFIGSVGVDGGVHFIDQHEVMVWGNGELFKVLKLHRTPLLRAAHFVSFPPFRFAFSGGGDSFNSCSNYSFSSDYLL